MISERIDRGRIGLGANDRRAIVAIAELDAPALILRIAERGDFRGALGAFAIGLRPAALEITGLGVDLAEREGAAHVPTRPFLLTTPGRASLRGGGARRG